MRLGRRPQQVGEIEPGLGELSLVDAAQASQAFELAVRRIAPGGGLLEVESIAEHRITMLPGYSHPAQAFDPVVQERNDLLSIGELRASRREFEFVVGAILLFDARTAFLARTERPLGVHQPGPGQVEPAVEREAVAIEVCDRVVEVCVAGRELGFDPGQRGPRLTCRTPLDVVLDRGIRDALRAEGRLLPGDVEPVLESTQIGLQADPFELVLLSLQDVTQATSVLVERLHAFFGEPEIGATILEHASVLRFLLGRVLPGLQHAVEGWNRKGGRVGDDFARVARESGFDGGAAQLEGAGPDLGLTPLFEYADQACGKFCTGRGRGQVALGFARSLQRR